jgi:hypothetical protein
VIGRRVATVEGITQPGDYAGPFDGYTADKKAVFFLLPIAHDPDAPEAAKHLHHVASPPHTFRECADGSLEIRESIGAIGYDPSLPYIWHGYLDEGHAWAADDRFDDKQFCVLCDGSPEHEPDCLWLRARQAVEQADTNDERTMHVTVNSFGEWILEKDDGGTPTRVAVKW